MMLRWDPKSRGSGFEENRPKCFTFLETILNFKVKKISNDRCKLKSGGRYLFILNTKKSMSRT